MKKLVVAVFDEKANVFGRPIEALTKGEAIRGFGDGVKMKDTLLNQHPEDHSLYLLAEYDNDSGQIKSLSQPEFLARGTEFVLRPTEVVSVDE